MQNFDNLSMEEKIKFINETAGRAMENAIPVIKMLSRAIEEVSEAVGHIADRVFTPGFVDKLMRKVKKERHRKNYTRMVSRRAAKRKLNHG